MNGRWLLAVGLCLGAATSAAQQAFTYVQTGNGATQYALGYPVPLPVESLAPTDAFRSYPSLQARLEAIDAEQVEIVAIEIGTTLNGRPIPAYVIGDSNTTTADGRMESAILINGGIHAREWQSPEVSVGIIERYANQLDAGDPITRFLVDAQSMVVIPVLNVDGFLQTQRFPNRTWVGRDPNSNLTPREGRMRRKNMRGADALFDTTGDHLRGIDLNRNNLPYWATTSSSSSDPNSLVYHGNSPFSEPETQALMAAALLGPEDRLRMYVDLHSFTMRFFTVLTSNVRRNLIQNRLTAVFADHHVAVSGSSRFPAGRRYIRDDDLPGTGIGVTSEYFAETYQIPSWTLEIEPANSAVEYGGFGVTRDGFILPESEIRRVREGLATSHQVAAYHQTGAPAIRRLQIVAAATGTVVSDQAWSDGGQQRRLTEAAGGTLLVGADYRATITFDKPMRVIESGDAIGFPGLGDRLQPVSMTLTDSAGSVVPVVVGRQHWPTAAGSFARYMGDTVQIEFAIPVGAAPTATATLAVSAVDLTGMRLDANPATPVDWANGAWTGLERTTNATATGDLGGPDASYALSLVDIDDQIAFQLAGPIVEGGCTELTVNRTGAGTDQVVVDFDPALGLPALVLADGEFSGVVEVCWPDNTRVDAAELNLVASVDGATSELLPQLQLIDNDREDRSVIAVADSHALLDAIGQASAQRPLTIVLSADEYAFDTVSSNRGGANAWPLIRTDIDIQGNDAELFCAETAPAMRLAFVEVGGRLQLQGLRLRDCYAQAGSNPEALHGGLIYNAGELIVADSTLSGGRADGRGGALFNAGGTLRIQGSALIDNRANFGGAIGSLQGDFSVLDSSFVSNRADSDLHAVFARGGLLDHVTIQAPTNPAGAAIGGDGLTVVDSVFASVGASCGLEAAGVQSGGGNSFADDSCGLIDGDRVVNVTTSLNEQALAWTPFLLPDNPANIAPATGCSRPDQRGLPRRDGCIGGAVVAQTLPANGLYWVPDQPGFGIDLQWVDNVAQMIWYTHDDAGTPIALQLQSAIADDGVMSGPAVLFAAANGTVSGVAIGDLTATWNPQRTAFDWRWNVDHPRLATLGEVRFEPFDAPTGSQNIGGIWADLADLGWGVSINQAGTALVLGVYYYDSNGDLRWATGAAPLSGGRAVVPLTATSDNCVGCAAQAQQATAAGVANIVFLDDGRADFDLTLAYPFAPGGRFDRPGAQLTRLSSVRPPMR